MRRYFPPMRRVTVCLIFTLCFLTAFASDAATGRIVKVLPHLLDAKGRHATSPSLYDRDAYQARLRANRGEQSGIRYDVQWKAKATTRVVKLRLELRGPAKDGEIGSKTIETEVKPGWVGRRWSGVALTGDEFKKFGEITAWRVTLWDGEQLLGEQKSFLW